MKYISLSLVIIFILAGCSRLAGPDEMASSVQTQPPVEAINPETGEVDDDVFESSQQVSEYDSLESIETDLDQTIILEEDFSDLGL